MNEIKFEVGKIYSVFGAKFLVHYRTDEKIIFRNSDGRFFTVKILKDSKGTEFVQIPGEYL